MHNAISLSSINENLFDKKIEVISDRKCTDFRIKNVLTKFVSFLKPETPLKLELHIFGHIDSVIASSGWLSFGWTIIVNGCQSTHTHTIGHNLLFMYLLFQSFAPHSFTFTVHTGWECPYYEPKTSMASLRCVVQWCWKWRYVTAFQTSANIHTPANPSYEPKSEW